jgi:outer membrane protein
VSEASIIFVNMRSKLWVLAMIVLPLSTLAQEKWDLRRCVEYAMKNNVSVKQADIQARMAGLQAEQAKLNRYPSLNFNSGLGMQFGRSIDPTTNQFTTTQLLYQSGQLNGGVDVFNWGRLKSNLKAANFTAQAALADIEKAANDVALSVATYYLQTLASKEQISIVEVQAAQTMSRFTFTKAKVDAGALPELNLAEVQSQIATDSANLINAQSSYQQNLLLLKNVLNLDPATPFEIETPPVDRIPLENIADMQPEAVYAIAMSNFPQQRSNELKIKAATENIKVAKSGMYPSITLGYSLGTSFSNPVKTIDQSKAPVLLGYENTGIFANVNGTNYNVIQPKYQVNTYNRNFFQLWNGYGDQLNQNFRQSLGFNIAVPIFNNGSYRIGYERSKLDLKNYELQRESSDLRLKQDIYSAYINAVSAMQKFNAGQKTIDAAQKAYDFSVRRYEVGLLNTLDLIISQNNLLTAKLQQLTNQYDYVFRMKLLEFYKGQGLKL